MAHTEAGLVVPVTNISYVVDAEGLVAAKDAKVVGNDLAVVDQHYYY